MQAQNPPLTPAQFDRYQRHLSLPNLGLRGQQALLGARVLLVGAGGLGCPLAQYLAAAGVGTLGIAEFDRVDASNLQRQVLYGTRDIGRPKLEVARERIEAQNPDVRVRAHPERLAASNALAILADYDVVVDGTDNFPTRYLTNDACVLLHKPNVHGAIFRFEGQASVFDASRGPCYRCLFPEPPPPGAVPNCAEGGVLGVLPGLVALVQATETIKLLTGIGESLVGRLLQIDALRMEFHEFRVRKDPECPVCGVAPSITELIDYEGFCGMPHTSADPAIPELSVADLAALRGRAAAHLLLDVREPEEHARAQIEGSRLIPLGDLEGQLGALADWRERKVVVHCHHGGRSLRACELLRRNGFRDVSNLRGGIDAWSLSIDAAVPRY